MLAGADILALPPTGGGKSLCYQLPALVPGLVLVISPLIADEGPGQRSTPTSATFLNSSIDKRDRRGTAGRARSRRLSPALRRARAVGVAEFLNRLERWDVQRVAVDEAHCVSEWGHDFRPSIGNSRCCANACRTLPTIAVTATATIGCATISNGFCNCARRSVRRELQPAEPPVPRLRSAIRSSSSWPGPASVPAAASSTSQAAPPPKIGGRSRAGISAVPYHAGLTPNVRARNQERFVAMRSRSCATIAFGMGIDKPNVRYVVHYDVPKNLEGYYQETGRPVATACRATACCSKRWRRGRQRHFIQQISDDANARRAVLAQMLDYASTSTSARARAALLADAPANAATATTASTRSNDSTARWPRRSSSRVCTALRASRLLDRRQHVIDVLLVPRPRRCARGGARRSRRSAWAELSRDEWMALLSELIRLGYVEQESAHKTVSLTADGMSALKEKREVSFAPPRFVSAKGKKKTRKGASTTAEPFEEDLFEHLRRLRKALADDQGVPPYVVFSDAALKEMARVKPTTLLRFRGVSGVGDVKLERYGTAFVEAIAAFEEGKGGDSG